MKRLTTLKVCLMRWVLGKSLLIDNLDGSFTLEQINVFTVESNERKELSDTKKPSTSSQISPEFELTSLMVHLLWKKLMFLLLNLMNTKSYLTPINHERAARLVSVISVFFFLSG